MSQSTFESVVSRRSQQAAGLPADTNVVWIDSGTVARALAAIALLFIVLDVVGQYMRWHHGSTSHLINVFSMDDEKNPPALYASALLFCAALVLAAIARIESGTRSSRYWWILACGFLVMAFDEAFAFHEKLITPVRGMLGADYAPAFHFAWVIPGLVVVAVVAVYFYRFLWGLPAVTRKRFTVAAAMYVGGALGMEMVGSHYFALYGSDMTQSLIAIAEEALELFGVILFISAALQHAAAHRARVQLSFRS